MTLTQLPCRKCLGTDLAYRYEQVAYDHVITDHLRVQCNRCGYDWIQPCADAVEPSLDVSAVVKP